MEAPRPHAQSKPVLSSDKSVPSVEVVSPPKVVSKEDSVVTQVVSSLKEVSISEVIPKVSKGKDVVVVEEVPDSAQSGSVSAVGVKTSDQMEKAEGTVTPSPETYYDPKFEDHVLEPGQKRRKSVSPLRSRIKQKKIGGACSKVETDEFSSDDSMST